MISKLFYGACVFMLWTHSVFSQWIEIIDVQINQVLTELGGPAIGISYQLNADNVSLDKPIYVFLRSSMDHGTSWEPVDPTYLQGDGFGMVTSSGLKDVTWWGSGVVDGAQPEIKIRGLPMARIPAGEFNMKSFPAGGKDPFKPERPDTNLPEYYMAINETTNSMYADFLNDMGKNGSWWHDRMSSTKRGGITKSDSAERTIYKTIQGREDYPIIYVSWYDAYAFLSWCGLTLPTEVMWEKAFVGGLCLDGDETKLTANPNPDRKYPWGNEAPDEGGVYRCNFDGDEDGFSNQAPVGTFSDFQSPYGINDLAGNVSEWTLDWYTTTYHIGLDGFRMVRGGSWLALPFECDAVSGATQFPIKESSIMGFRGAKVK